MRRLLAIIVVIVLLWGIVLPRLSQTTTVRQREAWLEQKGIDPAAMFYTDLPLLD
ncbi:hypothetical protein [Roseiconus lacunae]|uniref:Uncharacterized protein n=1 Tax=Roseiconus lacunae TaxID=2605694 RepID=A0ABT7PLC3_9BACT|nr:hypothetical protein [Roseiconus lacunae]MCD0460721.1 hypothetical protein [Roseiconus lacunae]MDM4017074.1 hypothetical protein [Roseiconus lacunae]WRQ51344.1 hypothetical protein U8335_02135 [Stieleria sp. HD01]